MNREIKFRGQRIPNREWVYGSLVNNLWCYSDLSDFKEGTPICEIITGKYEGDCWEDVVAGDEESVITVYPDTVGQFTGLLDKHNNPIYEGDIVIGYYGWMKGDGYKKKGFPDRVRFLFEIKWSDGKRANAGFYLDEIGVYPDDKFATDEYFYRSVQFNLRESREVELKNNEVQWNGCNESLEIIGNIFSNPELLQQ